MRILLCMCLVHTQLQVNRSIDLSEIRHLFVNAPIREDDENRLRKIMLNINSDTDNPVLVCYKGAIEMIRAKYVFNPFVKLELFNKGKELLEKGIKRDTLNPEARFIRFSIQNNLPLMLGYHDEVNTDRQFLQEQTKNMNDSELKAMFVHYLNMQKK